MDPGTAADVATNVWELLMEVARSNPRLRVTAIGAAAGALGGGLAGAMIYYAGKTEPTAEGAALAGLTGAAVGGVIGASAANAWAGRTVLQILEEMGPDERRTLGHSKLHFSFPSP